MQFKTLTMYQLTQATGAVLKNMATGMQNHPFVECPPTSHRSSGFVPPLGAGEITYETEGAVLFCLRTDEKTVPASYIQHAIEEYVKANDKEMSPVDIRVLKQELIDQALPHQVPAIRYTFGYIDKKLAMLFLCEADKDALDRYMDNIKKALGGTPFQHLGIKDEPCDFFTNWLKVPATLPPELKLGDSCSLKHPKDGGTSVINWKCDDMESPEMKAMLDAGKQCCRISLKHDDADFAITANLGIRRLELSPDQLINIDNDGNDIPALFATTVKVVRGILSVLEDSLGGWPKQELLDLGDEMVTQ
jgi:recombination associated protein RdgC